MGRKKTPDGNAGGHVPSGPGVGRGSIPRRGDVRSASSHVPPREKGSRFTPVVVSPRRSFRHQGLHVFL